MSNVNTSLRIRLMLRRLASTLAPRQDAAPSRHTTRHQDASSAPDRSDRPGAAPWRRARVHCGRRLFLLVVASVVPLVCMGVVREYLDYSADREASIESL